MVPLDEADGHFIIEDSELRVRHASAVRVDPAGAVMTALETGWCYGLIPPLQIISFEVTSVIGFHRK